MYALNFVFSIFSLGMRSMKGYMRKLSLKLLLVEERSVYDLITYETGAIFFIELGFWVCK